MNPLIFACLAAFGLGYWLNLPADEHGYDLAEIEAMNRLVERAMQSQDWLSELVAAQEGGAHAE